MKNIFLVEQVNQMEFNAEHNESIMMAMNEANESLEEKLKSLQEQYDSVSELIKDREVYQAEKVILEKQIAKLEA